MRGSCNETRWLTILVTFNTLGDDMLYTMDRNLLNSRELRDPFTHIGTLFVRKPG
jgi:hypothetical protein